MRASLFYSPILVLSLLAQANAASLLDQFQPGLGTLVAIGIDPNTGNVVVYPEFDASMHVFNQSGVLVGAVPRPGTSANDYDIDYSLGPMNIGGTVVGAGRMLVFNGDDNPNRLFALDPNGNVLAGVPLPVTTLVGGAHIPGTNQIVTVEWAGSDFLRIINANDGSEVAFFNAGPPPFDIFYGDIDVSATTGEITVVSSSQNIVRRITQQGVCVKELDVGPLGISGMSGVAIERVTGNLWISSINGSFYHVDPDGAGAAGFVDCPAPDSDGDGHADTIDNCIAVPNPAQRDTDSDRIGNFCDPDVAQPNDCNVNFPDLNVYKSNFFAAGDLDTDNNGDGQTNFLDLNIVKSFFFGPPGPSAIGCN